MSSLLALTAAATFGVADFLGGLSTRRASVVAVSLLTNVTGVVFALVLVGVVGGTWSTETIVWAAVGGVCGLIGLMLLYAGLAQGPNKLVSPLSAVVAAVVPVIAGLGLGERPGRLGVAGLLLTPLAVWLLAGGGLTGGTSSDDEWRRSMLIGVGAGLGFGFFFTFLAQVPDGSGAVPLVVVRTVSLSILVVAVAVSRPTFPEPRWIGASIVVGMLDMTANALFLWSSRDGDLAVIGALVNLFPATTVLLAVFVLGERLSRAQAAGLVLAIGAAALLG